MQIVPYEKVDSDYLSNHPEYIYVHNENLCSSHLNPKNGRIVEGWGFNDKLEANRYGFITYISRYKKRTGNYFDEFTFNDYKDLVYPVEERLLIDFIEHNKDKFFLIDPLGYGEIGRYLIFDYIIKPRLYEALKPYDNGMLLWDKLETRYLTNK